MTRPENFKKKRMEEQILQTMNRLLRTHFSDVRLQHITFTRVEITVNFSHAKVYWDSFDLKRKTDSTSALGGIKGKMRSLLAEILPIRQIPQLQFIHDARFESEKNITDILKKEYESKA